VLGFDASANPLFNEESCSLPEGWLDNLGPANRAVGLLDVGSIEQERESGLLAPGWVRCLDGRGRIMRLMLQFRPADQGMNCVIYGPHGQPVGAR